MNMLEEIINSPSLLKEIYGDVAKPGAQQLGKALAALLGLGYTAVLPVALLNEKAKIAFEKNIDRYRKKIENISENDICEVAPEIGVPIIEKFSYVTNEEIAGMYAELLAKASSKNSVNQAHPSFVNIINNMSPDEAILLRSLKNSTIIPYVCVQHTHLKKKGFQILEQVMPLVSCRDMLTFPDNVNSYISNFSGLGLVEIRNDRYMIGDGIYEQLERMAQDKYKKVIELTKDTMKLECHKGQIEITTFGRMFINACLD